MDLNQLIAEYSENLKTEHHVGAISLPIPSKIDTDVLGLIDLFMRSTPKERAFISSKFGVDHSSILLGVSERLAALAVRVSSPDILLKGLVLLAFEDAKFDVRENILVMAPLYHSAVKIGVDPKPLFTAGAAYATDEELKASMCKFPDRAEADRSLEAMDYVESMGPDGYRYKRTW